jgi:lipooligosaccharide transport system permease protein
MFLFSGTFFPISQLPGWLEPVAWFTPLWHGVELCRSLATGDLGPLDVLHTAVLAALAALGCVLAVRTYRSTMEI